MKIDAFCHVLPRPYFDRLQQISSDRAANLLKRTAPIRSLYDLDERLRVIEPFDDYAQIISLAAPPIEALGEPAESAELARLANDAMADLVATRPDRSSAFVAGAADERRRRGAGRRSTARSASWARSGSSSTRT